MFADVIVDIAHSQVDKIFEYKIDCDGVFVGSRVHVPFGNSIVEGIVINVRQTSNYPLEKIKSVLKVLEETPALTLETLAMANYISEYCHVPKASALRLFLPVEMRKGKVKEQFVRVASLAGGIVLENAISSLRKTAVKQKECLDFLFAEGEKDLAFLNESFGSQAVKGLIDKGFIAVRAEKRRRSPYKELGSDRKKVLLTKKQNEAVRSVENTDKTISLIYGVTGSGKTEVYLELIDRAIQRGKTAIMLVPEIALTPQMLRQLRARFGESVSILHSGLSAGERFDEWWRLRNGEAKIAIGARSAIFAPVENLGVIIMDEEHDGSYVSESSPRYSTVDIAAFRAKYAKCKLILGSATPSLESYLRAKNGEYNLIELPDRINKKPLPNVEIADMRGEIRRGNNSPFSSLLKSELKQCLDNGNQAMIFLNQRGYSKSVICSECGHVQ